MKIALRVLSLLILAVVSIFYAGCKKDDGDEETVEKKQLDKLVGDWTMQSANDGQDRTVDFPGLVLHLQGNYVEGGTYNYSFTGERPDPSPWPVSGTWKFGTDKNVDIIRDPGGVNEIPMDYQVTATELILIFTVPDGSAGWEGGISRVNNVVGTWTFTFTK